MQWYFTLEQYFISLSLIHLYWQCARVLISTSFCILPDSRFEYLLRLPCLHQMHIKFKQLDPALYPRLGIHIINSLPTDVLRANGVFRVFIDISDPEVGKYQLEHFSGNLGTASNDHIA
jgi:hypothetical protein